MSEIALESSYPDLKYPSLRDNKIKTPYIWMLGKSMDDCTDGLWRIHDNLYDFNSFISNHPGGEEWLLMTKGTDITEAFEANHLSTIPETIMKKYFVKKATVKRNSPFTFEENGFYRTLKSRVIKVLKDVPRKDTEKSKRLIEFLAVTMFTLSVLMCFVQSIWWRILVAMPTGLLMAWTATCAHNFVHQRNNWRMYLMNFMSFTTREFRIAHVLSHHLYPNTLFDYEVSGFEPHFQWLPRKSKTIYRRYASRVYAILIYIVVIDMAFISRYLSVMFYKTPTWFNMEDIIPLTLPLIMYTASGCGLVTVVINWLIILHFSGVFLSLIGINSAHHHPNIFHDGDAPVKGGDWGLHQLHAVMDRVEVNKSFFRVMTSFGEHGLHHLFPTLDHAILPYLHPVFLETCKEFQTELRMTTQFKLFIGQFQQMARVDCKL